MTQPKQQRDPWRNPVVAPGNEPVTGEANADRPSTVPTNREQDAFTDPRSLPHYVGVARPDPSKPYPERLRKSFPVNAEGEVDLSEPESFSEPPDERKATVPAERQV